MGNLVFWHGSGDLATWVQAVGTIAAFWAVGAGLRRDRKNRQADDLRHIEGVGAAFLTAAGHFMTILNGHRALWNGPRLIRLGERRGAVAMMERATLPLIDASVKVSLLGHDELTTAAGRITDFMEKIGPAYEGSERDWKRMADEYQTLLGQFRIALDAVRRVNTR